MILFVERNLKILQIFFYININFFEYYFFLKNNIHNILNIFQKYLYQINAIKLFLIFQNSLSINDI